MRRSSLLIALFAAVPALSFAAPPSGITYGSTYSVSAGGTITYSCPAGYTCVPIVGDGQSTGFAQWELIPQTQPAGLPAGVTASFMHTIGDDGAGFANESFVQVLRTQGGTQQQATQSGIAAQQTLNDTSTGVDFSTTSEINTGFAAVTGNPNVTINQALVTPNPAQGEDFNTTFSYASNNDAATGAATGKQIDVTQLNGLFSAGGAVTDKQVFELHQLQGDMLTGSGSATLGGTTGGTVSWAAGEDIKVTWIGQVISGDPNNQMFQGSTFGYQAVDNATDAADPITFFSTIDTGPFAGGWPADLGTPPTF